MRIDADSLAKLFTDAGRATDADFTVIPVDPRPRNAHVAMSREGTGAVIVPVIRVSSDTTRLTHGMTLRAVPALEFSEASQRWTQPAAVLECRDASLKLTFAAVAASLIHRLRDVQLPTWEDVLSIFLEWESLLGRRELLRGDAEIGLWGELWCLAETARPSALLDAWRGPEADSIDYFLDAVGFEVKAGRQRGVHIVSQTQVAVDPDAGEVVLVSLHVAIDPIRGRTLPEMVEAVGGRVDDLPTLDEKIAGVGYSRDDAAAYNRRFALIEAPMFFRIESVPRVRHADPGVSQLRYRVELPLELALDGDARSRLNRILGLERD